VGLLVSDKKGIVHNAIIVGGVLARPQATHPELLDIPYIVIENEHEPGSPDGISTLFPIIDVQAALNGTVSHGFSPSRMTSIRRGRLPGRIRRPFRRGLFRRQARLPPCLPPPR
jgi:hypothetical protein